MTSFLPFLFCAQLLGLVVNTLAAPTALLPKRATSCTWPGEGPGTYSCEEVSEGQTISNIKYDVYRWPQVQANSSHLTYLNTALNDISSLYSGFLKDNDLRVSFFIVDQMTFVSDPPAEAAAEPHPTDGNSHCLVQIPTLSGPGGAPRPEESFKRTVAHEVYHCVQFRFGQIATTLQSDETANWWLEGTAEFMAAWFYPDHDTQTQQEGIKSYDPTLALYQAALGGDSASIFFQYMNNVLWEPEQVHEWMLQQKFVQTLELEESRISGDVQLYSMFHHFATAYIDEAIKFKDGTPVTPLTGIPPISFDVPVSDLWDYPVDIAPWIMNVYQTKFAADKIVSMTYTVTEPGDVNTILQYRKGFTGSWTTLNPGDEVDLQNTDTTQCPTGDSSWTFLVTSTNDVAQNTIQADGKSHAKISFTVQDVKKKRDDGDSCQQPLDQCLIGTWNLDIPSMQSYLSQQMSTLQDVSVTNLAVTGSSTLAITPEFLSTMTFDKLEISYDGAASDISFHTIIDIDGSTEGTLTTGQGSSTFTWSQDSTSIGSIHTDTTIPSLGSDLPLDFPIDQQYSSQTNVQYTCNGDTLNLVASMNGSYVWAYTWTRAG